jgi:hypothetical protein
MDAEGVLGDMAKMAHAVRVRATSLRAPPGATDDVQFAGLERMSTRRTGGLHHLMSATLASAPLPDCHATKASCR